MKKNLLTGVIIAISLFASPIAAKDKKSSKPAKDFTIIKLNGESLKNSAVLEIWDGLFKGAEKPDFLTFDENVRQNVLRGLVSERLIYREAVKAGVDKSKDVKKRVENLRKQMIIQAFMEEKSKSLVTDKEIKEAYDKKIAESKGDKEVKARHILVLTEKEAKEIAKSLKKGGDFEKIAKEKSTDKGTGVKGGDLGWFTKDKMVPEFSDAAFKLKKGEVSEPVKTAFGWHIIKVEDQRPVKPRSFEESKEGIRAHLAGQAVKKYIEKLLNEASIQYFDENGKEKEFRRSLLPPETDKKAKDKK